MWVRLLLAARLDVAKRRLGAGRLGLMRHARVAPPRAPHVTHTLRPMHPSCEGGWSTLEKLAHCTQCLTKSAEQAERLAEYGMVELLVRAAG